MKAKPTVLIAVLFVVLALAGCEDQPPGYEQKSDLGEAPEVTADGGEEEATVNASSNIDGLWKGTSTIIEFVVTEGEQADGSVVSGDGQEWIGVEQAMSMEVHSDESGGGSAVLVHAGGQGQNLTYTRVGDTLTFEGEGIEAMEAELARDYAGFTMEGFAATEAPDLSFARWSFHLKKPK